MTTYHDELWLTGIYPLATVAQIEAFVERVAIKMADGTNETTARAEAYREIIENV
jgi:hypothetical protein